MLSFFNDHGCEFLPETSLEYQEYNGAEEDLEDAPEAADIGQTIYEIEYGERDFAHLIGI